MISALLFIKKIKEEVKVPIVFLVCVTGGKSALKALKKTLTRVKKQEAVMLKKMLLALVCVLCLFGFMASDADAATSDRGFVIVKCTVTVSVQVLDSNATWYINGTTNGVGPSSGGEQAAYISGHSSITVRNNSAGAICKWTLHVSTIERSADLSSWAADAGDGMWMLDDGDGTTGVNIAQLDAVFTSASSVNTDFTTLSTNDSLIMRASANAADTYQQSTGAGTRFVPTTGAEYPSAMPSGSAYNYVLPTGGDAYRNLHLRFSPPTAVSDSEWRRFVIVVTASTN